MPQRLSRQELRGGPAVAPRAGGMEYRFKDAPPEPQEGGRLKFVLKRPDGAKRVAPSAPIPVKYALEDEIVDEGLQRGGLRKTKVLAALLAHALTRICTVKAPIAFP